MRNTSSTSAVRLSRSPQFEHVTHRVYRSSDLFPCFRPSGRFSVKEACWLPMALLLPQILADRIPGHIMKFRAYLSRITSDLFDDLIDLHKGDYIRYYTWGNGVASRSALLIAEFMTFTILAVWRGDDPSAAYVSAQCSSSPLLSISRLRDRRSLAVATFRRNQAAPLALVAKTATSAATIDDPLCHRAGASFGSSFPSR